MLWQDKVQTIDGNPYYLANGSTCDGKNVNKLWNTGSYWAYANYGIINLFCADRGSGDDNSYKPNVAFNFNMPKAITRVV